MQTWYIFIFQNAKRVSEKYHDGGSFAVVAQGIEQVKELIADYNIKNKWGDLADDVIQLSKEDWEKYLVYELKHELYKPRVLVFPNAGCC